MKKRTSKAKRRRPIQAWVVVDRDGCPLECACTQYTAGLLKTLLYCQYPERRPFRVVPVREVTK